MYIFSFPPNAYAYSCQIGFSSLFSVSFEFIGGLFAIVVSYYFPQHELYISRYHKLYVNNSFSKCNVYAEYVRA